MKAPPSSKSPQIFFSDLIKESHTTESALVGDRPIRVLLVEDNRADYLYTRALFNAIKTTTYELDWVSTYSAGERELLREVHDVYLLDYQLGDGTGLDLLRHAIANGCKRPLIVLTAYGDDNIDIEAIRAGAADYIMKGEFDARVLERAIRYAIGRSQTLEALRRSQERYALAMYGANDVIWDWDLVNNSMYISPRWNEMLGIRDEDIKNEKGFDAKDFLLRLHPEDNEALVNRLRDHIKGLVPHFECEIRLLHENGDYLWVNVRGLAVRDPATGIATRIAGSMTNTTERTIQDHQLRAILSSMVEGVIAVDGGLKIVHLNDIAGKIFRINPEDAIGKYIGQISPIIEITQILESAVKEGRAVRGKAHVTLSDKDGQSSGVAQEKVLELRASPLRAAHKDVSGAALIIHDITELGRLEGLQREFVANVSHELKTPLSAILGMVDTLIDDTDMNPDQQRSYLRRVGDQSERLSALVSDLLVLSRAESVQRRVERSPIDLCEIAYNTLYRLESALTEKALEFKKEIPDQPIMVLGDEELLLQVFDNLLTNAIRYTPEKGSIRMRLKTQGPKAVLEVEDTGIGIALKHHNRIFERFYRVDKARSRAAGGTGLGLAIVKNIMLTLEGNISVESAPNRGSTFRAILPLISKGS